MLVESDVRRSMWNSSSFWRIANAARLALASHICLPVRSILNRGGLAVYLLG